MIIAYLVAGLACGALAALTLLLSGAGIWLAFLAYCGVGALGIVLAAGLAVALTSPEKPAIAQAT